MLLIPKSKQIEKTLWLLNFCNAHFQSSKLLMILLFSFSSRAALTHTYCGEVTLACWGRERETWKQGDREGKRVSESHSLMNLFCIASSRAWCAFSACMAVEHSLANMVRIRCSPEPAIVQTRPMFNNFVFTVIWQKKICMICSICPKALWHFTLIVCVHAVSENILVILNCNWHVFAY